jgi:uncharacterized protein
MMQVMKQVLIIGGGMPHFDKYAEFLDYLRNKTVDSPWEEYTDWKRHLGEYLGPGYQVGRPTMPNRENARYGEWKIWLEKHLPYIDDGVLLVGHSLGAVFLAKYLSENTFPKKIRGTFLVAAPFDMAGTGERGHSMGEFTPPVSLQKFAEQGGDIFLYHSKDDPVVAFGELSKYQQALPNATVRIFDDRGHMYNQKQFSELVEDIKSLR